ncbi:MAG: hypothetical protein RLY20_1836, partial [Verrucomicrobiota bacterium]
MKTANNLASAATTLAALGQLRQSIRDAVMHGSQADREFKTRADKLRAQHELAIEGERSRFASEMDAARSGSEARRNEIEAYFVTRKSTLARSLGNARQRKMGEIDAEESRHTFAIQRDLLEADRVRETDTANNKATREAFVTRLASELANLEHLETEARSTVSAYGSWAKLVGNTPAAAFDTSAHENDLVEKLHGKLADVSRELGRIRAQVLPLVFKFLPIWLWVIVVVGLPFALEPALRKFDFANAPMPKIAGIVVGGLVVAFGLYLLGKKMAHPAAKLAAQALADARKLHEVCAQKAEASFANESQRIAAVHGETTKFQNGLWKQKQVEAKALKDDWSQRLESRARTLHSVTDGRRIHRLAQIDEAHAKQVEQLTAESAARKAQFEATYTDGLGKLTATRDAVWKTVEAEWQNTVLPAYNSIHAAAEVANSVFPKWEPEAWRSFKMPEEFAQAARFADMSVDLEALCGVRLDNERLMLSGPRRFTLPLLLAVPDCAALLFETKHSGEQVVGALNNLILRLLTSAPPGRLEFTIFDPVGLGQNFAGLMHL